MPEMENANQKKLKRKMREKNTLTKQSSNFIYKSRMS